MSLYSSIVPKAKDLKAFSDLGHLSNSPIDRLFVTVISSIVSNVERGESSCNVFTDGYHLTDEQLEAIRDAGYECDWNRACL